jgi:hypothetical protein
MPNLAASASIFFLTGIKHLGNPNTDFYSAVFRIQTRIIDGVRFETRFRLYSTYTVEGRDLL